MKWFLAISIIFLAQTAFCQFQKIFNQSIEIKDELRIDVRLNGDVTFEAWEGTFVLIETRVTLENANENIFRALVKEGRYLTNVQRDDDNISLMSDSNLGHKIKTSSGETSEGIVFKIYYPSKFKLQGKNILINSDQSLNSSLKGNQ